MAAVMVNAGRRSYEERMAEQRQKLREALIFNQHAPPPGLGPTTSARLHPLHATDQANLWLYSHAGGGGHRRKLSALFKEWDENGDGVVDKEEFRRAVPRLGEVLNIPMLREIPADDIDALYDSMDPDGDGMISYKVHCLGGLNLQANQQRYSWRRVCCCSPLLGG